MIQTETIVKVVCENLLEPDGCLTGSLQFGFPVDDPKKPFRWDKALKHARSEAEAAGWQLSDDDDGTTTARCPRHVQ